MNRKLIVFLIIAALTGIFLFSCSSKSAPAPAAAPAAESAAPQDVSYDSNQSMELEGESGVVASKLPEGRKIIKTCYIDVETKDTEKLYKDIAKYVEQQNGYEESYRIRNVNELVFIDVVIKIPPENLNALVYFIGENGTVLNNTMDSEDVTEEYYDVQGRLETKKKAREQYYELLKQTDTIEEIVAVQRTIDEITAEIEAFEGRLKVLNSLSRMSTVNLHIGQISDPLKTKKEIKWDALSVEDMSYLIKTGFVSASNIIIAIVQWLLIAVLALSPVLIIAAVVVFIFYKLMKKRKKKKVSAKNTEDTSKKAEKAEKEE